MCCRIGVVVVWICAFAAHSVFGEEVAVRIEWNVPQLTNAAVYLNVWAVTDEVESPFAEGIQPDYRPNMANARVDFRGHRQVTFTKGDHVLVKLSYDRSRNNERKRVEAFKVFKASPDERILAFSRDDLIYGEKFYRLVYPMNLVAKGGKNHMQMNIHVSSHGKAKVTRYARIKKQSGTYHHYFAFALFDDNDEALWYSPCDKLTIGAALTSLGQPKSHEKTASAVHEISKDVLSKAAYVVTFFDVKEKGQDLWEQFKEGNRKWTEIRNSEIGKDLQKLVVAETDDGTQ